MGSQYLKKVDILGGITEFGDGAFAYCGSLADVSIGEGTIKIPAAAFESCGKLKNVKIPEGVTEIQYDSFRNCGSLMNVTIPKSVKTIGLRAFGYVLSDEPDEYGMYISKVKPDFTIYGYAGTEAQKYAEDNGVRFVEISESEELVVDLQTSHTEYELGSDEEVVFHCNGNLKDFKRLVIDGQEVPSDKYTLAEGSTILKLSKDYLETLDPGEHDVVLEYTSGATLCTITVKGNSAEGNDPVNPKPENPTPGENQGGTGNSGTTGSDNGNNSGTATGSVQTGDTDRGMLWAGLCLAALILCQVAVQYRREGML